MQYKFMASSRGKEKGNNPLGYFPLTVAKTLIEYTKVLPLL